MGFSLNLKNMIYKIKNSQGGAHSAFLLLFCEACYT